MPFFGKNPNEKSFKSSILTFLHFKRLIFVVAYLPTFLLSSDPSTDDFLPHLGEGWWNQTRLNERNLNTKNESIHGHKGEAEDQERRYK